ncbi:coenzyme F430 synthase [uncultured Methanospirillum sp.]|uniref:coenzyme F430 synthase n=1 Tax=uncultured Methanospirillum sp. TaxID=262503 RepID=UPI0029C72C27|nr:coenzyme F430 synthase [uncultured Methanospirillum sp.]
MQILILDIIHGGIILGDALKGMGHTVDLVDVYRGDLSHPGSITCETAMSRRYDLLIHPVHLDPSYPVLRGLSCPAITHHEAVRWILGSGRETRPTGHEKTGISIEITGARGKTTTATALASLMDGYGILHTSRGIFRYPEEEKITRMSITPASLISVHALLSDTDWCITEISLGFTGLSDLAILTSDEDYRIASGRLSARTLKHLSALSCRKVLIAPGMTSEHDSVINAKDLTQVTGGICTYSYKDMEGSFENPLLTLEGYRTPLQLATAAALILGYRPDKLSNFASLPGRMKITSEEGRMIIDNASTGACLKTTLDAIALLRGTEDQITPFTLIIGQENRAVCENFSDNEIIAAIRKGRPATAILVAGDDRMNVDAISGACQEQAVPITTVNSITEGMQVAREKPASPIVVSVKTWR